MGLTSLQSIHPYTHPYIHTPVHSCTHTPYTCTLIDPYTHIMSGLFFEVDAPAPAHTHTHTHKSLICSLPPLHFRYVSNAEKEPMLSEEDAEKYVTPAIEALAAFDDM